MYNVHVHTYIHVSYTHVHVHVYMNMNLTYMYIYMNMYIIILHRASSNVMAAGVRYIKTIHFIDFKWYKQRQQANA